MTFTIYKDESGEWRWKLTASNGRKVGDSGEGYKAKSHCRKMIELIRRESREATVIEEKGNGS